MAEKKKSKWRRFRIVLGITGVILISLVLLFHFMTTIRPPDIKDRSAESLQVTKAGTDYYTCKTSWLRKIEPGIWEMYIEGESFERGVIIGKLTKELLEKQEQAFVDQIREMVPSGFYLKFLKYFIYWFNRNMDDYMPEECKREIYGISLSASDKFSFIGSGYQRMLNYHSAHDIGHALQNLHLVGCTSFGTWNGLSKDKNLLIGRNFDFYMGDAFAENKIVCFERPDTGHPFMYVTWSGMIGTVSGMNLEGLTVTINADKSDIPSSARTPISILAREILQYAGTVEEAYAIAKKYRTFVSESILVGSARDNKAVIIEKSPGKTALFESGMDYIICSNHFLGKEFVNDPLAIGDRQEMVSVYRYKRVLQDITGQQPLDPVSVAAILRDRAGLNNKNIGMGNEKAINQLICHHSVIFEPSLHLAWVSAGPWQLGPYVCYNISEIFNKFAVPGENAEVSEPDKMIPADEFLQADGYRDFLRFRKERKEIRQMIRNGEKSMTDRSFIDGFIASNPAFFETWDIMGDYYRFLGQPDSAAYYYRCALGKEIPGTSEKKKIVGKLSDCVVKANKKK